MARIAGVDLPREKRLEVALTYIYGIGLPTSHKILAKTGVSPDVRVRDLSDDEVAKLREIIDKEFKIEGDLRAKFPSISSVLWKLVPIVACAIGVDFPFEVSARKPMPVLVRVRLRLLEQNVKSKKGG